MMNLSGVSDCDITIQKELTEAGIRVVRVKRMNGEVPASIEGQLSCFNFRRAWYYWIVEGDLPLMIAEEMYATEVGKKAVRVAGHAGCPPPKEWARPHLSDADLFNIEHNILKIPGRGVSNADIRKLCESGMITSPLYVSCYHIDSQEGLKLFADIVKKHHVM